MAVRFPRFYNYGMGQDYYDDDCRNYQILPYDHVEYTEKAIRNLKGTRTGSYSHGPKIESWSEMFKHEMQGQMTFGVGTKLRDIWSAMSSISDAVITRINTDDDGDITIYWKKG